MIDYNLEIKTKEELCSWFLAETDWLADCIDGGLLCLYRTITDILRGREV